MQNFYQKYAVIICVIFIIFMLYMTSSHSFVDSLYFLTMMFGIFMFSRELDA